ncbi:hypothetical protein [Pseudohongiella sp.]|uniref:DUF4440 domain-containing protein n=1 Tax=marine sediment metagenome TaxID=412755 RepID=A0A0F9WJR9_9ZZZZ|nr:hypothetical protein [Pseudohongiella sp.]HDZ08143.1 hypothetical protein [Pseudohongiella sp.]HEA63111.1 hypothetical protein [Pseudohongiella sp.]
MKPALIIVTVIACLSLAGIFAHSVYQRNMAVQESTTLVMTVTTDMLVNWDPQTVRRHADDALLAQENAESMQRRYTPMGRRLGALQEIYDIRYQIDMPAWWQVNGQVSASYTMNARFESEVATVRISLFRQQGRWLISAFDVQPPAIAS